MWILYIKLVSIYLNLLFRSSKPDIQRLTQYTLLRLKNLKIKIFYIINILTNCSLKYVLISWRHLQDAWAEFPNRECLQKRCDRSAGVRQSRAVSVARGRGRQRAADRSVGFQRSRRLHAAPAPPPAEAVA